MPPPPPMPIDLHVTYPEIAKYSVEYLVGTEDAGLQEQSRVPVLAPEFPAVKVHRPADIRAVVLGCNQESGDEERTGKVMHRSNGVLEAQDTTERQVKVANPVETTTATGQGQNSSLNLPSLVETVVDVW